MSSLKKKTIDGLSWSAVAQVGKQISQFVITAILARLLSPNDFGLLAMATVFTNFVLIFNELGISGALIQNLNISIRHYSSAFWLNVIVGCVLTLFFILASPFISGFYKKPELLPILSTLSVNFVLTSFTIIQQTLLIKEMDFKKIAIRDIGAVILSGIIGIFLALNGFGVWSLVYQTLSFTIINSLLLWALSPWRPQFIFLISDIKDIFDFSVKVTGFNIINYIARNIDQLLIGKFLGTQALGYYSLAYRIMLYPLQKISGVIGKVMFPAFSKIQNDIEKVRNIYKRMVKAISLVTFPMMLGLFAIAPEFVRVFFGIKWLPIIFILRIFCVCGMVQSIGTTIGNILLSQGRAGLQLKMQILGTSIVILAILMGLKWGIEGVAVFYTIQSLIWVHYTFYVTNRLINLKYFKFYYALKISYTIGIIVLLTILLFKHFFVMPANCSLIYSIIVGSFVYLISLIVFNEITISRRKMFIKVLG